MVDACGGSGALMASPPRARDAELARLVGVIATS